MREPAFTFTAGPVAATPQTLRDLARPIVYHYDPSFIDLYASVVKKLAIAYRTDSAPVILQGEAVLGLEAAAASLISADDIVLNLVSGVFGKGFGHWADRYNKEMIEIVVPYNESITPEQVEDAFKARPDISVVAVVHCDTPSGTTNPVREIGAIAHAHGALLLVDAVATFCGMDVDPEGWHADIVVAAPQKCLAGPPGLSLLYVSDRAWEHMAANPVAPRASMLSILDWKDVHLPDKAFPFTPSVSDIFALDSVLTQYLDEGADAVLRRHALSAAATRAGVKAAGLALWPAREEIAADTVTAVAVPEGVDAKAVQRIARERYDVMFSAGAGEIADKLWRIGHFGPVAGPMFPAIAIVALGSALLDVGYHVDISAGVEAAMRVMRHGLQRDAVGEVRTIGSN
jgi:pyridoxamine--pyruvate transaminase